VANVQHTLRNTLQHAATRCKTLQHIPGDRPPMQHAREYPPYKAPRQIVPPTINGVAYSAAQDVPAAVCVLHFSGYNMIDELPMS